MIFKSINTEFKLKLLNVIKPLPRGKNLPLVNIKLGSIRLYSRNFQSKISTLGID